MSTAFFLFFLKKRFLIFLIQNLFVFTFLHSVPVLNSLTTPVLRKSGQMSCDPLCVPAPTQSVLLCCILAGNADSLIAIFSLLDTEGMEIDRTWSCTGFEVAGHVRFIAF